MSVGIVLILLGLAAAAVAVDFAVENDIGTAPAQSFSLFGGTFEGSTSELVIGGAVLGALAVVFVFLGTGLLRGSWGRRRALKHRLSDLQRENDELRSRAHLSTLESEPDA
jgi:hypothetical protein